MPRFLSIILFLMIFLFSLMGCGQKGPLYLPSETPQQNHNGA